MMTLDYKATTHHDCTRLAKFGPRLHFLSSWTDVLEQLRSAAPTHISTTGSRPAPTDLSEEHSCKMVSASENRDLFGGAITVKLPTGFIDASDFRQVPDNQEVLVRDDSDISLIIEVLQLATDEGADQSLDKAVEFHFDSLAHDNSASSSSIQATNIPSQQQPQPPATPAPALLTGSQLVRKFGKASEPEESVTIHVALWRLVEKNIDLVLSVNEPANASSPASSPSSLAHAAFEMAASSLQIRDWDLFA